MRSIMEEPRERLDHQPETFLAGSEDRTKRLTGEGSPQTIDGKFTVETYTSLHPKDIKPGDQAYVHTESGNTYRMTWSVSRPDVLKLEGNDRKLQYAIPRRGEKLIVKQGEQMHYMRINDINDLTKGATTMQSSPVKNIEVWRNYVVARDALEQELKQSASQGGIGGQMAAGITDAATGTSQQRDFRKTK